VTTVTCVDPDYDECEEEEEGGEDVVDPEKRRSAIQVSYAELSKYSSLCNVAMYTVYYC